VKITDLELIQLAKTLDHPHRNSKQTMVRRVFSLVRVVTDEGIDGLGEAGCDPSVAPGVIARLKRHVVGMDPFNVEELWQQAFHGAAMYDPKGAAIAAISGVDIACWDVMGKALGVPVHRLLGGQSRRAIPAYASDLHWLEAPEEMARAAARYVEEGFTAVKTHLGVDPEGDESRVRAIREAIGDDVLRGRRIRLSRAIR